MMFMCDQENNSKGLIPLKFTPLIFQTPTGNQLFNSSRLNPSGLPKSDANHLPPDTPRPMIPPSTWSQSSKSTKVTSSSGSSKTHSLNFPPSSLKVLFPHPSAPFSGSNNQQVPKPKSKSGPIKPPLQQVQQNDVPMETEEKGQVGAQLRGVFEQVQLLQNSNNYEQLFESFQQTGKSLEEFGKNQCTMISLVQELKRISDVMLADHQQMMKEKGAQKGVLQGHEVQVLAQLRNVTDERDGIQHKLNETTQERDRVIQDIEKMERIVLEQRNHYENEMVNVNEAFNNLMNERDNVVEELAEEKSRVQALLNELKKWRDQVNNQTSSSNLGSGKQEKRPREDQQVETNGYLPPTPRTANVDVQEIALSSANRAVSTGTNSRKIKRGASKDRKALN